MEEHLESKPDPIARQSDLEILRADQRTEHWKTRVAVVGVTVVANISRLSLLFAAIAIHLGWLPKSWWPF